MARVQNWEAGMVAGGEIGILAFGGKEKDNRRRRRKWSEMANQEQGLDDKETAASDMDVGGNNTKSA